MWVVEYIEDGMILFHYEETEEEAFDYVYAHGLNDYEVYEEAV